MGGYNIPRESGEATISLHMSNARCLSGSDRDRQPGKDRIRNSRCLVTQNDDDETTFKSIPRSTNLVDGFTDYELLPKITHSAFYILDSDRKVTNKRYHTFDNDRTVSSGHKPTNVSRTLVA